MGCHKLIHQTRDAAEEHMRNLIARGDEHPARLARLMVYPCQVCLGGIYHVGHRSTETQRRERRKLRVAA